MGESVTLTELPAVITFAASSAVGDPLFVGLCGQVYQVHGMDGAVYSLLSQSSLSINARFVFLTSGRCPVVNGERLHYCWSHPGSYFGAVSVQTATGDRLELLAGSASQGYARVALNGRELSVGNGSLVEGYGMSVLRSTSHALHIVVGNYELRLENSDAFINLVAIRVTDWQQLLAVDQPHGLLGQTWSNEACTADKRRQRQTNADGTMSLPHVIEGDVDDYATSSDDLFATDCMYNKFATAQS